MTTATISKMRWVLMAVLCLALAGCGETFSWHQKMTIIVETPEGQRVGSSVGKVSWRDGTGPSEMGMGQVGFVGEAVVVELPNNKYLFVLIKDAATLAQYVVLDKSMLKKKLPERARALQQVGREGLVPKERFPMLVTFDDISKPETVKRVDPENLAASFGAGYALKSITLEVTDEPVTEGRVERVLGWLGMLKGGYLHGGITSKGSPLGLHGGDFQRGEN